MFSDKKVTFVSGGGVGEVGRNHFIYEFGNHVLIIDCGIMPRSQEERERLESERDEDLVWTAPHYPKLEILDQKMKARKEVSALITHSHLDHIGAVSRLIERRIPIRLSNWTKRFFITRYLGSFISEEDLGKANFISFPEGEYAFQFGDFSIKCFPLFHSIPSTFGVLMRVGGKNIIHLTDFKFNGLEESRSVLENKLFEIKRDCGKIDCLAMDVLNAEMEGFTPPEKIVVQNLEKIIEETKQGRVFITFFSSNIQRLGEILRVCKELRRPVRVLGQGMKISRQDFLGSNGRSPYQGRKPRLRPFAGHPNEVVLLAGCQGEENSHIWRTLIGGWTTPDGKFVKSDVRIRPHDTVIFSSRIIPGNKKPIKNLMEALYRRRVRIIIHEGEAQKLQLPFRAEEEFVHVSGHGHKQDILRLIEIVEPEMIIPVHAEPSKVEILARFLGSDSKKLVKLSIGETLKI